MIFIGVFHMKFLCTKFPKNRCISCGSVAWNHLTLSCDILIIIINESAWEGGCSFIWTLHNNQYFSNQIIFKLCYKAFRSTLSSAIFWPLNARYAALIFLYHLTHSSCNKSLIYTACVLSELLLLFSYFISVVSSAPETYYNLLHLLKIEFYFSYPSID